MSAPKPRPKLFAELCIYLQFQLKVPAHKAEALAREALDAAPDGVNVDAVLRVQGPAFNDSLASARQAPLTSGPRQGPSPRRTLRPGALGSPSGRLGGSASAVSLPSAASILSSFAASSSASPSAAAFFAAADGQSPSASHAVAAGSHPAASDAAPVVGAGSPARPHGLRALVLPGQGSPASLISPAGGAGGLASPLDSLPARKLQTLRSTPDIWSEIAKSRALAEAAEAEEARLKDAERREALKGGLEEQVAERRRRRQDELRQKASEAREVIAHTVRQEKEALKSQVAAAEARRKAIDEQAAVNARMLAEKRAEEDKRVVEERRAVEALEASIRQDAERTQAKRTEYIGALRVFLADNGKFQEEKAAAAQRSKADGVHVLRAAIEAEEAHERRRQAELAERLATLQKRLDRRVVLVVPKVASDREIEERADRELREFLRRQDEAAKRADGERRRGLEEQITELERQVAEKRRAKEAQRAAGRVERERTQRQVRDAEKAEKRGAAERAAAVVAHKAELEAQIIESRRALQVPDESEVERRLNATLLETYRAKATGRVPGSGEKGSPAGKGSTSHFF